MADTADRLFSPTRAYCLCHSRHHVGARPPGENCSLFVQEGVAVAVVCDVVAAAASCWDWSADGDLGDLLGGSGMRRGA